VKAVKSAAMETTPMKAAETTMTAKPASGRRDSWRQQTNSRHRE
jgi:hypothetical protein